MVAACKHYTVGCFYARVDPMLRHNTHKFTAPDGETLFEQWWRPQSDPKAAVVFVHGVGEHSARYTHVAHYLLEHGYAVNALDLRGHGRSGGVRGFCRHFDDYIADVDLFLSRAAARTPDKPLFVLGHSMGGAIVTLLWLKHRPAVQGLILSSAALKTNVELPPLLLRSSKILSALLPRVPTVRLDSKLISHDPAVVETYDNDPLVFHRGLLARTGAELLQAFERIDAQMEDLTPPLLILHGTDDQITDPAGSQALYARAGATDKTLKLYDGFYHELLNEVEKERVMADIVAWLDARVGAGV